MEKSVEFEIADYIKEVLEMKEVEPEGYFTSYPGLYRGQHL